MRKIVVVALVLLSLSCANAQAEDCKLKMVASYDMLPVDGAVIIPVQMAGKARPMGISVQSVFGGVSEALVDEMALERRRIRPDAQVYTAHTRVPQYVVVPSVDIGSVHQDRVRFAVSDALGAADGGVIGNDILSVFDIELDFAARKVRFFSQEHCKGNVVYWSASHVDIPFQLGCDVVQFTMKLDGHDVATTFDLGASYSALNWRVARGVFGLDETSPHITQIETKDGRTVPSARFETLSVGGLNIPHPSLLLFDDDLRSMARYDTPDKMQNQPGYDLLHAAHLVLGLDALKHLRVYIAYKERMIYLTAADAH